MNENEITRWLCLYVAVSIFQLSAAADAASRGLWIWLAWFVLSWLGLLVLMSRLVMLMRYEDSLETDDDESDRLAAQ